MPEGLTVHADSITETSSQRSFSGIRELSIFFLVYLSAALILQQLSGTYHSELGHDPDEPSHVMTALMIRDYLVSGFHSSPLQYAENYYLHYPKVALGMWPPFFHIVSGVWMLIAQPQHNSLLVFMAVQCSVFATTLACFARHYYSSLVAFGLGLLLVLLPATQLATSEFMADLFVSILEFWAMLLLAEYFHSGRMRAGLAFGLCTGLALFTKANANALLLLPFLVAALTRRFDVFKKWPTYASMAVIVLVGLPWQFFSLYLFHGKIALPHISIMRAGVLFEGYVYVLVRQLGLPIFLLGVAAVVTVCFRLLFRRENSTTGTSYELATAASFVFAVLLFHSIAPIPGNGPNARYTTPELPLFLFFAYLGVRSLAGIISIPNVSPAWKSTALTLLVLAFFAGRVFGIPQRPKLGFSDAAQLLSTSHRGTVLMVCSDSEGEGAFITSVAFREVRPDHIILRGSKVLSDNPWFVAQYKPYFQSPVELEAYLESVGVIAVVVDLSNTLWEQDRALLLKTLQEYRSQWSLYAEIPRGRANSRDIVIYIRPGTPPNTAAVAKIRARLGI